MSRARWAAGAAMVVAMAALAGAAEAAEVRVTLHGVEARGGQILIALQNEQSFMQPRSEYGKAETAQPGTMTFVFEDVAPGEYALSAVHDANSNQSMDMAPEGMPAEGFAMSNGSTLTGPPSFGQVKFTVGAEAVTLTENMMYFMPQ